MQSTATRTREEVSERRKTTLAVLAIVAGLYSLLHWGVPRLLNDPAPSGPLFGFMSEWPSWVIHGTPILDYFFLVGVLLWCSTQLDNAFERDGEAPISTLNNVKIPTLMFGPVILLFTVSFFGWLLGTFMAILAGAGSFVVMTCTFILAHLMIKGLSSFGRLISKTYTRLAQTGVGHHLANYLDAKDIPASDPSKE